MAVQSIGFVRSHQTDAMPPPNLVRGPVAWIRQSLFSSPANGILTIAVLALLYVVIPPVVRFMLIDAVWTGADRSVCREDVVHHAVGACWAFVGDRLGYFTYGSYPVALRWRVDIWFLMMA